MSKRLASGTEEAGCSIQIDGDMVDIRSWYDHEDCHQETITLERFKEKLGL